MGQVRLPNLVIPNGQSVSNALNRNNLRYLLAVTVFPPTVLDAGTYTIEVTADGTNWVTLQEGGADATLTAGKARTVDEPSYLGFRIKSSVNATADRTFMLVGYDMC